MNNKKFLHKSYSTPVIVKKDPKVWYISFHHVVPEPLRQFKDLYPYSKKRFKIYKGINSTSLTEYEREKLAEDIRKAVEYGLKSGAYDPFEEQMRALEMVPTIKTKFAVQKALNEEDRRKTVSVHEALQAFLESRKGVGLEPKTISTYKSVIKWLEEGLPDIKISEVKYIHVSHALNKIAKEKNWKAGTINHSWEFCIIIFNWLAVEDFVYKNPLLGKVKKLKTEKTLHKWYDRETAKKVVKALKNDTETPFLLRVCQFTYWTMIRSKKELQSIKVGDINFDLHQICFRKEWTKNDSDQNRDYPPEFQKVLDEMGIKDLPKDWYIFGSGGVPGPKKCGPNTFTNAWMPFRKKLGLSPDYTIYGWKHTRIIHLMMLGHSAYEIAHAARHSVSKTSEDYKRDYDISLTKVYDKKDLTFDVDTDN